MLPQRDWNLVVSELSTNDKILVYRCKRCKNYPKWHYWPATKGWSLTCHGLVANDICGMRVTYYSTKIEAITWWNKMIREEKDKK